MYIRLPLETTYNTRDLGGYATNNGHTTQWRKILRSDDVAYLSAKDIQFLESYGVKHAIDLRGVQERAESGYPLVHSQQIQCHHLPLVPRLDNADATQHNMEILQQGMGAFYIDCLDNAQAEILAVLTLIAEKAQQNEGILFHCAAGKDRTGIISMLLLHISGVPESDILANYEVTYTYIKDNPKFQNITEQMNESVIRSDRAFLEQAITHLKEKYGNFENYYQTIGLTNNFQRSIKEFLTA